MWFIARTSSSFITLASQFIIIYHTCIIQSPRLQWHQRAVIHSSTRGSTKTSGFDKLSWNSFSCLICWAFATFPLLIFYLTLFAGPIKCQFLKWHHWWPAARNPPSRLFIILNIIISPQSFFLNGITDDLKETLLFFLPAGCSCLITVLWLLFWLFCLSFWLFLLSFSAACSNELSSLIIAGKSFCRGTFTKLGWPQWNAGRVHRYHSLLSFISALAFSFLDFILLLFILTESEGSSTHTGKWGTDEEGAIETQL